MEDLETELGEGLGPDASEAKGLFWELAFEGEGVVTAFVICAEGIVEMTVFIDEDTLVEDVEEEKLVFLETAFWASSWSTSFCSLLTFSTKAFLFASSS